MHNIFHPLRNGGCRNEAAGLIAQCMNGYASLFGFCEPYLWLLLNSPLKIVFLIVPDFPYLSKDGLQGILILWKERELSDSCAARSANPDAWCVDRRQIMGTRLCHVPRLQKPLIYVGWVEPAEPIEDDFVLRINRSRLFCHR